MQLLNSCLDIFEIRRRNTSVDQDLGLLHAFEERFASYGWVTNTEVKFLIIVDMEGKPNTVEPNTKNATSLIGLRDADLKPVSRQSPVADVLYSFLPIRLFERYKLHTSNSFKTLFITRMMTALSSRTLFLLVPPEFPTANSFAK